MASILTKITAESAGGSPYEFASVGIETDNDFAPSTDQAYEGSYSYKSSFGGTNEGAYGISNTFSDKSEVWLVGYVYISSDFNFGSTYRSADCLSIWDGTTNVVDVCVLREGGAGPVKWQVHDRTNTAASTTNFSLSAWHKIKIHWIRGTSTDGTAEVWVDDSLIHQVSNITTSFYIDRCRVGSTSRNAPSAGYLYMDSVEMFDSDPDIGGSSVVPIIMMNTNQFNGGMI